MITNETNIRAICLALLAAALYALNAPASKLLLRETAPTMLAALLYLGAGAGMAVVGLVRKARGKTKEVEKLTKKELPYTMGMILLDIAAPVLLMVGLSFTTAENAALLNNFEIVATALIALLLFRERISLKLWLAIGLITVSSILLSVEDAGSLSFSLGSVFVLLACLCWGLENNCTRKLSVKDPLQIVVVKGFGSGFGSLCIAFAVEETLPGLSAVLLSLLLGFVAYGLSIYFYVTAQRTLGAAKTSAYYAVAPFIGAGLSLLIFQDHPAVMFWIALGLMAAGAALATVDSMKAGQGE